MLPPTLLLFPLILFHLAQARVIVNTPDDLPSTTFDIIVVGGGLTGLAVAGRLSERDPKLSVLVVEAGPDNRTSPAVVNLLGYNQSAGGPQDWAWEADSGRVIQGYVTSISHRRVLSRNSEARRLEAPPRSTVLCGRVVMQPRSTVMQVSSLHPRHHGLTKTLQNTCLGPRPSMGQQRYKVKSSTQPSIPAFTAFLALSKHRSPTRNSTLR